MNIKEILRNKRLYLDGAMGSLLQSKLDRVGPIPEVLNVTHPEVIREIHQLYIDAGANIGLTSIYFANKFPNAKIVALEPEIDNYIILQKNIQK